MTVWILKAGYRGETILGVYTEAAKAAVEQTYLDDASRRRDNKVNSLRRQIDEITAIRNPTIYKAEAMLTDEATAKEAGHMSRLKEIRKERKALLRHADKLTYDIHSLERQVLNLTSLTQQQLLDSFSPDRYFEEYTVEDV